VAISSDQISAIMPNTKVSYPSGSFPHACAQPRRTAAGERSSPLYAVELADAPGRDVGAFPPYGLPFSCEPGRQLPDLLGGAYISGEQHRGPKVTEKPCFSSVRIRD